MFSTKRSGWYFLRAVAPIQVGTSGTIYFKQKIHSSHPEFNKIAQKYFIDGYLKHESFIPLGERGQYKEFTGGINPPKFDAVSEPAAPAVEAPQVTEPQVEEPEYLADPINDESFGPELVEDPQVEEPQAEEPKVEETQEVLEPEETEASQAEEPQATESQADEKTTTKKRTNKKKK